MRKYTQKYTIAHLIDALPDGYEYAIGDWPLHVTLADIFTIESSADYLLRDLRRQLATAHTCQSDVTGDAWFGKDKNIHVKLLQQTSALQQLHETILSILSRHGAVFNNQQHIREGFTPHSTVHKNEYLTHGETVTFDSVTLIDLFPEQNPHRRRVLGTVYFS